MKAGAQGTAHRHHPPLDKGFGQGQEAAGGVCQHQGQPGRPLHQDSGCTALLGVCEEEWDEERFALTCLLDLNYYCVISCSSSLIEGHEVT